MKIICKAKVYMYVSTDADLQDYYIKTDKSSSVTVNLLSMPDRLCLQRKPVKHSTIHVHLLALRGPFINWFGPDTKHS